MLPSFPHFPLKVRPHPTTPIPAVNVTQPILICVHLGCNLDDTHAPALAVAIQALSNLSELDLSHNGFTETGGKLIAQSLEALPVGEVDLSHNPLGDEGIKACAEIISTIPTIEVLIVGGLSVSFLFQFEFNFGFCRRW